MEWLQAHPALPWKAFFQAHYPLEAFSVSPQEDRFTLCERINFRYMPSERPPAPPPPELVLVPLTVEHFLQLEGSVVPKHFWRDAETWKREGGVGFCLLAGKEPVSWSFSSSRNPHQLELGIETLPLYRGKGLARIVCERLLQYCAQMRVEPIWCCRRSNIASCKLAAALGFAEIHRPTGPIPYYHLPVLPSSLSLDYRRTV